MNEIDDILMNIDRDDDLGAAPDAAENKADTETVIESIDGSLDEAAGETEKPHEAGGGKAAPGTEEQPISGPAGEGVREKQIEPPVFKIRGTKTFNMREPYLIKLDPGLLAYVSSELKQSFYFIDEPLSVDMVKVNIKKELVKYLRRPNEHLIRNYTEFIYRKIAAACDSISTGFELDRDTRDLFIYHIGPLTMYKIIAEELLLEKYGFCYKHLPANKAMRFFPDEFIKLVVMGWHEENINTLDLPFDSIQKYEEIKNIALKKYHADLKIFNTRWDQLNARVGANKSISRAKLYKVMGIRWFGIRKIEIYKRFVGAILFV